ncbi:hypothetical protein [Lysobacter sp. yr284]|uniref:hypothetical protein n=1 Tax=Lysobacter sp. yr284 TaxID=1761791 RepID=UPI0011139DB9|nr:hypothetical protein [Lysobacter sp. yr284]
MKAANWVQDTFRALPRYLFVLTAVSALALLARAAAPSFPRASVAHSESLVSVSAPRASVAAPASGDASLADAASAGAVPAYIAATNTASTNTSRMHRSPAGTALADTIVAGAAASRLVAQARLSKPARFGSHSPASRDFPAESQLKRAHAID